MAEFFYSIDLTVFYFFNHTIANPAFTRFFSIITNVNNWYITYVVLLGIMIVKGGKKGRIAAVGVLLLVAVGDMTGHRILKEIFERARPCNALLDVFAPLGCSGTYSFPSNHALNNFAVATYFSRLYPNLRYVLYTAASLIALSRVYLGLHYPSDIIAGAVFGFGLGLLFAYLHLKAFPERINRESFPVN